MFDIGIFETALLEEAMPELQILGGAELVYAKESDGKVKVSLHCNISGRDFAKGIVYDLIEEAAYEHDRLLGINDMNWALPYQERLAKCLAGSFRNTVKNEAAKALTGKSIYEGDAKLVKVAERKEAEGRRRNATALD